MKCPMKFTRLLFAFALAGLTGVFAQNAAANTIVQTHTTGAAQNIPFSSTLFFNTFDPSLGTLTQVIISGSADLAGTVSVYNVDSINHSFTNAAASTDVHITSPQGLSLNQTVVTGMVAGTVGPGGPTWFVAPSVTSNFAPVNVVDLTPYIATASNTTVSLNFASDNTHVQGTSDVPFKLFFGGGAQADGSVTLTYNYDSNSTTGGSVPAPGIAWMCLGLLVALGAMPIARRFHSSF